MFICKPCHEPYYACAHGFVSYGRCEVCEQPAECYDCGPNYIRKPGVLLPGEKQMLELKETSTDAED